MLEVTAREYLAMAKASPTGTMHYQATVAENNDEYLSAVQRALKLSINEIAGNRRHRQGHSEDALNTELVSLMRFSGLSTFHDVKYGGHTDISIRLGDDFLWIAEAKIWSGCSWVFSGLKQLGRYMSGLAGQRHGALIIYMFQSDAAGLLDSWRIRLSKLSRTVMSIELCDALLFTSKHRHLTSGAYVDIEHIAVPLFWNSDAEGL